jgi:hypothetical protein
MSLTLRNQPYVSWKGTSTSSVVPTWSRPLTNGLSTFTDNNNNNNNNNDSNAFKARPIKHWRKRLLNDNETLNNVSAVHNSRSSVGMPSDRPGGSVYLGVSNTNCSTCEKTAQLTELIPNNKNTIFNTGVKDPSGNCGPCNPVRNIIKSASTIVKKNYYSDRKSYLHSRGLTYAQKMTATPIQGNDYNNPPTDTSTGSQEWNTPQCLNDCSPVKQATTIYKPNNKQFAQQGAVSSSARIDRLKYNTITNNGSSLKTVYGSAGANVGKYHGTQEAPYFLKSKNERDCVPYRRNGKKTSFCST